MKLILSFCLACIGVQITTAQCVNRQHNAIYEYNWQPDTTDTYLNYPYLQSSPLYKTVKEVNIPTSQLKGIQPFNPTTIITDCSPAVCKTLIDIIQLMSVANLIKDKNGGADVAMQLAEPFLKDLMLTKTNSPLNPNFIPLCANPGVSNPMLPNLIQPSFPIAPPHYVNPNLISPVYPNVIGASNVIPNVPISTTRGVCNENSNALVRNLLNMLGN